MIIDADETALLSKDKQAAKGLALDGHGVKQEVSPPPYFAPPPQHPRPLRDPSHAGSSSSSSTYSGRQRNTSPPSPTRHHHHTSPRIRHQQSHSGRINQQHLQVSPSTSTLQPNHSLQNLAPVASREPPPPLSFSRSPPRHIGYPAFQPIFLIASGKFLDKGFPPVAPPTSIRPHPFAVHDVNQGDWIRFLDDLRRAASLTERQVLFAEELPIISLVPVVSSLVSHAVKSHMRRRKADSASQVVDTWNHHFFHPRKMEVILMMGPLRLSGQNDHPIPNLHTPETVNFSLTDVPGLTSGSSSTSGGNGSREGLHDDQQQADGQGKGKLTRPAPSFDKDKTYRLFVVSTTK